MFLTLTEMYHSAYEGVVGSLSLGPAWSTQLIPGQRRLNCKTVSGRKGGRRGGRKEGATGLLYLERNLVLKVGLAAKHMIIDREFSLSRGHFLALALCWAVLCNPGCIPSLRRGLQAMNLNFAMAAAHGWLDTAPSWFI